MGKSTEAHGDLTALESEQHKELNTPRAAAGPKRPS
jgi:hypothetical protein